MAVGFNYRASIYDTVGGTSFATTSTYTPASNSLLIACIQFSNQATPTSVTGHGVTWTRLSFTRTLDVTHQLEVYVADSGASPTSAAVTINFSLSRNGCSITEYEVTGVDLSGGVAAAIVQNPTNNGSGTSGSVTLASAGAAANRPIAFFVHLANEATTPRTNWTEPAGSDGSYFNPSTGAEVQYRSDTFETTASASWSSSSLWRGVALELKEGGASGSGSAFDALLIAP
jgi:hypothetical protein